ncbi:unnamed protein product [Clavelina lepadiformis]|uniref:2-phosphoxylose phosphatase 1 n=1 Tax=Clavelina lepadiformis TaxID=159417 RepID=A0ABP0FGF6_CLALP
MKVLKKSTFLIIMGVLCTSTICVWTLGGLNQSKKHHINYQKNNASPLSLIRENEVILHENENISNLSPARYYCNFPETFETDAIEEGTGEPGWKLKQAHVVIRHGDRTPLKFDLYKAMGVVPNFCNVFDDKTGNKFPVLIKYRETVSAQYDQALRKGVYVFTDPLPRSVLCSPGQLTSLGVLQQLNNGFALRRVYFDKHKLTAVKVISTRVRRTFQSAVAFLYGFLPDFNLLEVPVRTSPHPAFCESDCICRKVKKLQKLINEKHYEVYRRRQVKNPVIRKLSSTLSISDHTGVQIDSLVTGYLCKEMKLPCNISGTCVKDQDLNVIMNEHEYMNRISIEESAERNQSLLLVQPMLKMISGAMDQSVATDMNVGRLYLYSGHDTTVRPLLQALALPEYRWPRLGSRLVFELWEFQNKHFIKVIFNGLDMTSQSHFCKGLPGRSCLYSRFRDFVNYEIAEYFGSKTRTGACMQEN